MFRPAQKVPLVTLDDATLLRCEKESRKTQAKAHSKLLGSSVNLMLMSPMAVFGIASSAKISSREYWSHEELIKEVERRKLDVLPKTFDESGTALIGGQIAAIALGHTIGGLVADGVADGLASGIGEKLAHIAVDRVTENTLESATVSASGKIATALSSTVGTPTASTYSFPEDSSVITATKHLSGTWVGFAESDLTQISEDNLPHAKHTSGIKEVLGAAVSIASNHISSTTAAFQHASHSNTPVRTLIRDLTSTSINTASAVITCVIPGKRETEDFVVPIKYRCKFILNVDGVRVSGRNIVDELDIVGGHVHESGTAIEWAERSEKGGDDGRDLKVEYKAKISGGKMNGTWETSDGRKGKLTLLHL